MPLDNSNTQLSTLDLAPDHLETYYSSLMTQCTHSGNSTGQANRVFLAKMIASWVNGQGALPERLGLTADDYARLLQTCFPMSADELIHMADAAAHDPERLPEREEVLSLLLEYRANQDESEGWIAEIVVAACMGMDHLWQDLGLWSRNELSEMLMANFPGLAQLNQRNMKWKKFIYKQLCERDGTYVCRAPSCDVCADYQKCFGPEE